MKKVEAIIREEKLETVKRSLEDIGYFGMTITEVGGRGRQKGVPLKWGSREFRVDFLPKIKVEVVVRSQNVAEVLDAIARSAKTGQVGDGKIFVQDLCEVVRIRTGEAGEDAI